MKTKRLYFKSLNIKKITEPSGKLLFLFSQKKASKGEKIILNEAEKHISHDKKICTVFNNFFSNVVSNLKIPNYCNYFSQTNTHSLFSITETFEKYPSILNMKK